MEVILNIEKNTKGLTESAVVGCLSAIIFFIVSLIPIVNLLKFLVATPYLVVGKRHGSSYSLLSATLTATLIGLLYNPIESVFILTLGGLVAFSIIKAIEVKNQDRVALFVGTIVTLVSLTLFIWFVTSISGIDLKSEFTATLDLVMDDYYNATVEFGNEALAKQMMSDFALLKQTMLIMIPYSVVMMSFIHIMFNYFLAKAILKRSGNTLGTASKFSEFMIPKSFIYGSMLMGLTIYAFGYLGVNNIENILMNVIMIFVFIYAINGMAVVWWFGEAKRIPAGLRVVGLLVLMLFGALWLLGLLGLVDRVFNLRKIEIEE